MRAKVVPPIALTLSGVSVGVVLGLIRWSFWWPNRDMRQNYATAGILILGSLGIVALTYGMAMSSSPRQRLVLGCIAAVLALFISIGVYRELVDAFAAIR